MHAGTPISAPVYNLVTKIQVVSHPGIPIDGVDVSFTYIYIYVAPYRDNNIHMSYHMIVLTKFGRFKVPIQNAYI